MLLYSNCLDRPGQWLIHPDTGSVIHRGPPDQCGNMPFTHFTGRRDSKLDAHTLGCLQAAAAETYRYLVGTAPGHPVTFILRDEDHPLPEWILCDSAEGSQQGSWLVHTPPPFYAASIPDDGSPPSLFAPAGGGMVSDTVYDQIVSGEIYDRLHDIADKLAAESSSQTD